MKTYGSATHCQGCDQNAVCVPYIVTWDAFEYASVGHDDWERVERVHYCEDCANDVKASMDIGGYTLDGFELETAAHT